MGQRVTVVDAFTDRPFQGNPAAVCILADGAPDEWMAAVAREMNLSETAFVERRGGHWSLRWFTPAVEVELCGHATLAAAHVLWEEGHAGEQAQLRFQTRSGVLTARREGDAVVLDFPAEPADAVPAPDGLLRALGLESPRVVAVAQNRFDYLVEVADAATVRELAPDMGLLAGIPTRGVMVTAPGDDGVHDFVSRWFGPRVGVPEDPVTGSAHCCLGPWWARVVGRAELRGLQASRRGGSVTVRLRRDRVDLIGRAVTVLRGELFG